MISSEFFYTTCAYGAETALKNEILRLNPEIKPGFFKKGFVTFQFPRKLKGDFQLPVIFARAFGLSHKLIKIADQNYKELDHEIKLLRDQLGKEAVIHVFKRERYKTAEKVDLALLGLVSELRKKHQPQKLKEGTPVIDLVALEENEIFVGWHFHHDGHTNFIGGDPELVLPENAPSRAYLKIAEAFLRVKPMIKANQTVMDVGCAPGGASYFFLENKLNVIGVDSADMDDFISKNYKNKFYHLQKPISHVTIEDLVLPIDWLAVDMNVKPAILMMELKKLIPKLPQLFGAFITMKMPDVQSYEEIPKLLKQIKKLGFNSVQAVQLVSNKQEIFVYAEK